MPAGRSLSITALALCFPLMAPAADMAVGSPSFAAADQRMLQQRRELLAATLKLSPETAARFWPLYERYQAELTRIRLHRHALLGELGENYDNMSDADAREYVMDQLNLDEDRARLTKRYVLEMAKILSPRDLARFVQVEGKIKAFIEAGIEEDIPLIK